MPSDRADAAALRAKTRPEHEAYLAEAAERVAFAGPLLADDGETMLGSVLVIEFADRDAALATLAEPFKRTDVYGGSGVRAFRDCARSAPGSSTTRAERLC